MSAATAAEDSKRGGAKLDHSLDEESNKEPLKVHTVKVVEAEEVEKEEKGGEDTCENREKFGKKAIEELASELNKAAHTIREFTQNECDEEILKQLNDEQLLRLLEEAYHSKKLDEKNKTSIFKEILEDVHDSISKEEVTKVRNEEESSSCPSSLSLTNTKSPYGEISPEYHTNSTTYGNCSKQARSVSGHGCVRYLTITDDNDSDSIKTEQEEMEMDQLSDNDDLSSSPPFRQSKCYHDNTRDSGSSMAAAASATSQPKTNFVSLNRPIKPLSIYRHNPAFHSQHVSAVNQTEESSSSNVATASTTTTTNSYLPQHYHHRGPSPTPIPSPFSGTPTQPLSEDMERASRGTPPKTFRKKKRAVKTISVKAEEIDGYRGCDDLDSILEFIESKPGNYSAGDIAKKQANLQQTSSSVSASQTTTTANNKKPKRGADKKTSAARKRSRTPSAKVKDKTTKDTAPSSRASSVRPSVEKEVTPVVSVPVSKPEPSAIVKSSDSTVVDNIPDVEEDTNPFFTVVRRNNREISSGNSLYNGSRNNTLKRNKGKKRVNDVNQQQQNNLKPDVRLHGQLQQQVINPANNSSSKKSQQPQPNYKKPPHSSPETPPPPPPPPPTMSSGNEGSTLPKARQYAAVVASSTTISSDDPILSLPSVSPDNDSIKDEQESDQCSASAGEISNVGMEVVEASAESIEPEVEFSKITTDTSEESFCQDYDKDIASKLNYESILKFIKSEWEIVTMEISNGSNDVQSKVVYYKA